MLVKIGCEFIKIRNVETVVVVIILAFMPYLKYHDSEVEVQIDFGKGEHRRMISLNR